MLLNFLPDQSAKAQQYAACFWPPALLEFTIDLPSNAPSPPALPGSQPTRVDQRIASLDIARGLAVFGILLMNIQSFGLVSVAYENPFHQGT